MENLEKKHKNREFKLSTLALKNKNTIFLISFVIIIFGTLAYTSLPKELFPDIKIPTIIIQTIYPGNPPSDIENLITKVIEKEIKTVQGIDKINSTSSQDASLIIVEFTLDSDVDKALQDIKDAIDKIKSDLPSDLPSDPIVEDIDLSEMPVININLSGDYSLAELKDYAEFLQDEIETIYEISRVDIKGVEERELQINVDPLKLEAFEMSFSDIENAINSENISISGGEIKMGKIRRSIRSIGEFKNIEEIENIIVKSEKGNIVYLRDVAEVVDTYAEAQSYARLDKQSVVSLQVIKKSGENLLSAVDQIFKILDESKKTGDIDSRLKVTITNDQSKQVRSQISNLENSMIMGVIFVVLVLFFFLGLRNALFVGIAIPLSMLLSFAILSAIDATINMMTLFSLILALGMLVDNAIVVIENIYRFMDKGYKVFEAAKLAVGEIAMAIISSTATTLAAFFPLLFWNDIMGEFMKFMPITLIIVLTSSLIVALVIIPVFAATIVKDNEKESRPNKKKNIIVALTIIGISLIFYFSKSFGIANLLLMFGVLILLNLFVLFDLSVWFQKVFLTKLENWYLLAIQFTLKGNRPKLFLLGTVFLLIGTIMFMGARDLDVDFFPKTDPQYINIIAEFPIGTDVTVTDSVMKIMETDIIKIVEPYNNLIESMLTTVGTGAKREMEIAIGNTPNKSISTIKFIDFEYRNGISTMDVLKLLSDSLHNKYTGVEVFIEQNRMGPSTGYPINIEIKGKDINRIISISDSLQLLIKKNKINGIEGFKIDIETGNPELIVNIDRDKARRFGLSTYSISMAIRTALFGKELNDYKGRGDDYPIQLRLQEKYRNNLASIMNQKITFRNNQGKLMQVPISAVAEISYSTSFGSVKRKDLDRVVTLFSNVKAGYNANRINIDIKKAIKKYNLPIGYEYKFTGEQEEQKDTMNFLIGALVAAIALILIILVTQFNSFAKPLIIIASVVFSTIGVFGGIATFKMPIVILLTGVGIVSLAGVVVNNAIVLIDYIDYLKSKRKIALGLDENDNLEVQEIIECIVEGGKTRLRPVLLTAITTILGLLPMAIGLNINFVTMFTEFNPHIFFGGDNAAFWSSMSWTVIFGLSFATFLTLIIVPAMYLLANKAKLKAVNKN
ncbi:MAG: efflux RND transporter permease subunit [Bacteroidales bacterium]|nr:efflux RND transporter permease subunit [Bacteroidales bacterium]MBN2756918.1 efflux RND transporter permease subunit [Bacteroidales bacterium]